MHEFSKVAVREALEKLPIQGQSAFALACAARTFRTTRGELPQRVQELCLRSLEIGEKAAAGDSKSLASCVHLRGELEQVELDDDRVSTCAYALGHVACGDIEEALWAAQCAYEWRDQIAVDGLVFETFTPEVERTLLASRGVQSELECQATDIQELLSAPNRWRVVIERARGEHRDV